MTTIYRSPTIAIGDHEWHLAVVRKGRKVLRRYKWRPLSARPYAWRGIEAWPGRPPKLWIDFKRYFSSCQTAERYERDRAKIISS